MNRDTLLPYLSGLALREITGKRNDIQHDSSASDFVRLIWAYLITIADTSSKRSGSHPGLVMMDEPGQHSMAPRSLNEMLKTLADSSYLQSIVAASFDENDAVFDETTKDVNFNLISIPERLIDKLDVIQNN